MPLLELRDVSICAGGKMLLHGVNLSLQRGEIVALCGPSGLGKTSLLRAIAGLDDASAGTILLEEKLPDRWTYPAFRRRVVLVEQRPVVFDCSIEENLQRPFCYRAANCVFPTERAHNLLTRLQMPDAAQKARTLSQGQQQRLGLIRALLLQPAVLLLDEPTSALDSDAAHCVETLLREESKNGLAILLVTHDRTQAARLCDRVCEVGDWR